MSISLTFHIQLRSDYHISSGHRGELVDSALFRDADGIPAIRGTTVAALLRDGLRRLIGAVDSNAENTVHGLKRLCKASGLEGEVQYYCGQFEQKDDACPVCRVFGSPRSIKTWAVSSARPLNLRAPETRKDDQPNWASQDAMRVRVDPRSRRAEARKLFSQEEGDSRLAFEFTVTSVASKDAEKDAALIAAAARMVRNLGGSRRRGRGECLIVLSNAEVDGEAAGTQADWLEKFESYWLNSKTPDQAKKTGKKSPAKPAKKDDTGNSKRLRLLVRADEPILIARRAEAGNEFDGLEYIPGTVVRGAFAEMTANALGAYLDDLRSHFVELFFSDSVRFSPLYPIWAKGGRGRQSLPAPLDFHTCKLHSGLGKEGVGVLWKLSSANNMDAIECPRCAEKNLETTLEQLEKRIYVTAGSELDELEFNRQLEMHNTINPETGRVLETNLYSYYALPTGQFFVGDIDCEDESLGELLQEMANLPGVDQTFSLKLGKASRRGYGQTTAILKELEATATPLWIGRMLDQRVTDATQPLYLNLLTDAIIPDCWGRFYTGFDEEWLSEVMQMPVRIEQQFVASREVDSFNAHLGLPRWRDVALTAGSSCAITIDRSHANFDEAHAKLKERWAAQSGGDPNADDADVQALRWQMAKLEHEGIGLRRNEGFGRIAFNHSIYENVSALQSDFALPEALRLKSESDQQVFISEARFRKDWEERLIDSKEIKFDQCNHSNFAAVARLLRAEAQHLIAQAQDSDLFAGLQSRLKKLGERDNLDDELPPKEKNWFKEGKGETGLKQIQKAITRLDEHLQRGSYADHKRELAIIGVEMLADRIAAEANKAEQGA